MITPTIDPIDIPAPSPIAPEAPVSDAAASLRRPEVPAVVVCEDETIVGIVTESDIVAMVAETDDRLCVRDVMSTPVTTIESTATIARAADEMRAAGVKQLPVTSGGTYRGVLSARRLAPYCSRRRLDIEWEDEPLSLGPADGQTRSASD